MKFGLHNNSFRPVSGRVADIYPQLRERVQWAEANGFDYCSVMDHLWQIPLVGPAEEPFMEAWVTLGAIAATTERVHLTTMVTSVGYRNPALLAKMVATLDLISGGRALLGIGAGNTENEHNAYGYPFPRPGVRLAQLREAVQLIKALWQEERATYEGKQFMVRDAVLEPKPLQRPRPRVLIGGGGERVTLRIVAEEADLCNFGGPLETFAHKLEVLTRHCREAGRDVGEIEVTKSDRLILAPTMQKAEEKWRARGSPSMGGYRGLVGSPEDVVRALQEHESAGLQAQFVNVPPGDTEALELFAREVMPAFR